MACMELYMVLGYGSREKSTRELKIKKKFSSKIYELQQKRPVLN